MLDWYWIFPCVNQDIDFCFVSSLDIPNWVPIHLANMLSNNTVMTFNFFLLLFKVLYKYYGHIFPHIKYDWNSYVWVYRDFHKWRYLQIIKSILVGFSLINHPAFGVPGTLGKLPTWTEAATYRHRWGGRGAETLGNWRGIPSPKSWGYLYYFIFNM